MRAGVIAWKMGADADADAEAEARARVDSEGGGRNRQSRVLSSKTCARNSIQVV